MSTVIEFTSLPAAFLQKVKEGSDRLALADPPVVGSATFSYADMWRCSCAVAQGLIQQGIEKADRVGLLSVGRSWWSICDFAIMTTGAWTVPVYPSLPANQIGFIIRHAKMVGMFVENRKQLDKLLIAHEEEPLPLRFVVLIESISETDRDALETPWALFSYDDWRAGQADGREIERRMNEMSQNDTATIVYTSGTTGVPKGVTLTHGNILANIAGIRERLVIHAKDVHLSYLPLSHIFERTCGQFIQLLAGASIHFAENTDTIVRDFARIQPTTFSTVPRLLEKVQERVETQMRERGGLQASLFRRAMSIGMKTRVERHQAPGVPLKLYDQLVFRKIRRVMGGRLRMIVSGGAPLAPHVGRFFMAIGQPVIEGYGMTETSPVVAFNSPDAPRVGTVGKRLMNVQVKLAPDGELLVSGPSVTPGYFMNEEATCDVFTEDGWLKTGDIAEVSADGFINITDRKKHLLILSTGKKVTPAPIESDILRSSYIDQVCLVGNGQKFVSVIVVPNEDAMRQFERQNEAIALASDWRRELLGAEVMRYTAAYAKFEQPKAVIIATPFTVENDLMTPTLKVKANQVCAMYADEIGHVYGTSEIGSVVSDRTGSSINRGTQISG